MSQSGRLLLGMLLLILAVGAAPPDARALEMFPNADVQEAHRLRQRVLDAVPGLDLDRLRGGAKLSPESLTEPAQRLGALEGREAGNPFYHWLHGEILRRTQGAEAAEPAYERAAQAAGAKSVIHWILWQEHLARGLWRAAERHEQALVPMQVRAGLFHAPLLSEGLLGAAQQAVADGQQETAIRLFDQVLEYDPRRADALAGRAAARWGLSPGRLVAALRDGVRSVSASLGDRISAGRLISNLLLSGMTAWLLCLMLGVGIAALRTHAVFFHDLKEGPLRRFLPPAQWSLGLLVLLLPLMLGLGLLWTALVALLLLAPYLSTRERTVFTVLLAGLVLMPMGYRWIAAEHMLTASSRMATSLAAERGGVGDGLVAELEAWRTGSPNSGLAAYYLGLVRKRRGELDVAAADMAEAVKLRPNWSFAYTALGNIDFLKGRAEEAEANYKRAASLRPGFASAANLGALYAIQVQLEKSTDWMNRSAKLDPQAAARLTRVGASGGGAIMVDEPVPGSMLAAGLSEGDEDDAVAEGFWGAPLRGVRLRWLPGIALALLVAFWAHATLRRERVARRCQECGTPFCTQCQPDFRERTYCGPCAPVFREKEGIPGMVKLARRREADGWSRQERQRTAWLGILLPGGGWWYRGGVPAFPLCLVILWVLLEGIVLDLLAPSLRFPSPLPWTVRWTGALGVVLLLQGISAWGGRRLAKASRQDRPRPHRGEPGESGEAREGYEPLSVEK